MNKRQQVSQKARFEVFKRDKFTCQYCGRKAPEVVLNCDHIQPVAAGGLSDILNLVTSCAVCNGGKGATPLSDGAALHKQLDQLAELQERRQQLEMMLQWREELQELDAVAVEAVMQACSRGEFYPAASRRPTIQKWLRTFGLVELLAAVDESFLANFEGGSKETWLLSFSKIPGFATANRKVAAKPYLMRLYYIRAIIRNRTNCSDTLAFLEHLHLAGAPLDDLEESAKSTNYISHFTEEWENWADEVGHPWTRGRPWQ